MRFETDLYSPRLRSLNSSLVERSLIGSNPSFQVIHSAPSSFSCEFDTSPLSWFKDFRDFLLVPLKERLNFSFCHTFLNLDGMDGLLGVDKEFIEF